MNTSIQEYLEQYYSDMNEENKAILRFINFVPFQAQTALDFSYGGSLMITAELSKTIQHIDVSDVNEKTIQATLQFMDGKGFNWMPVFNEINVQPTQVLHALKNLYVAKFPASLRRNYDLITCFFALETASQNWREFCLYYNSLLHHLEPEGWLIIGLVTEQYKDIAGTNDHNPLYVTEEVFLKFIQPDIFQKIKACADWGYKGMLFSAQQNHSRP